MKLVPAGDVTLIAPDDELEDLTAASPLGDGSDEERVGINLDGTPLTLGDLRRKLRKSPSNPEDEGDGA